MQIINLDKVDKAIEYVSISDAEAALTCETKMYWGVVLKLKSKSFQAQLFVGSSMHFGLECFYNGMKLDKIMKVVKGYMNDYLQGRALSEKDRADCELCKAYVEGMLLAYFYQYRGDKKRYEVLHTEKRIILKFKELPIPYAGTLDLCVKSNKTGSVIMFEHKTVASEFYARNFIDTMPLNKQVLVYPWLLRKCLGLDVKFVMYNGIVKPNLRQKKNETFGQFAQRIKNIYTVNPDRFFIRHRERVTHDMVDRGFANLVQILTRMRALADRTGSLDPAQWIKNDKACYAYNKQCEFLPLCKFGAKPQSLVQYEERVDRYEGSEIFKKPKY